MNPQKNPFPERPTDAESDLPVWEYATPGPLRERLSGLTLAGVKTTTFDVVSNASAPGDVGSRWVMVGSDGAQLAVLEVIEALEMPLGEVPWELAEAEGESFVDLADWRLAHEHFWASLGLSVDDRTMVRCERVRVVERLPGAAGPRFPVVEVLVPSEDVDWVSSELAELDTIGIEEITGGFTTRGRPVEAGFTLLRAGFVSDELAARAETMLDGPYERRFEVLIGDDWLDAWRDGFEPVSVGDFLVWPDWKSGVEIPTGRDVGQVVRFDPGRAWGTGGHQSTKLALELLQDVPPTTLAHATVLDAGCGSGLLAVAAALLGAVHVDAVDIDITAPGVTDSNAARNGVGGRVHASNESVEAISQRNAGRYDVVLANILAPVLIELAPHLQIGLSTDGVLILAGLIDTQVDQIRNAFAPLTVVREVHDGVWRGLLLRRP